MFNFRNLYTKCSKHLHYIYLLYAIPMVCIAATITPPFQNPDEANHFARAEQVSRLELVPTFVFDKSNKNDSIAGIPKMFYPDKGGFAADKGIFNAYHIFLPMCFNPQVKTTSAKLDSAKNIKWEKGITYINFGNTAINPPVTYLMPAIGLIIGKLLSLPVTITLYFSRLLNAALSITLCFLALRLAKRSNLLMLIVLLFPMTIALFASVSPDAVLISCSFLLVAIIDDVEYGAEKVYINRQIFAITALMCIIGVAKPPYVIFAFVFLFLKLSKKLKAMMIAIPVMVVLSWLVINHANFLIKFAPADLRINSKMQIVNILHHPFEFVAMFFKFDGPAIVAVSHMFVGVLGWLDVSFTSLYYSIAYTILIVGAIIKLKISRQDNHSLKMGLVLTVLLATVAVLTAQYATWTALGANALGGMQGRYLLPIFPFVALAFVGSSFREIKITSFKKALFLLILIFPLYTGINLVVTLMNRYY